MNRTPAAARSFSALVTLTCWAGSLTSAAASPFDLRVVDTAGQPVAGVTIEFTDQPVGAFGVADLPVLRASNGAGLIEVAELSRPPLGFRATDNDWAIRFVHGHRIEEAGAAVDLLGFKPMVYDMTKDVVCVVEKTGTIEIEVLGAKADDQFHATFVDQRPEPESHRNVTVTGSFTGPRGSIRVPSGRGTLYLAQHGFIGGALLNREGPLMISVVPEQTSRVSARFLEGPTARLIAPFDTIPFENIQALAPDGETVVAELPFTASPLQVASRFAVVASGARPPSALPSVRFPKHLLRAVDVPLELPAIEDPNAVEAAKRYIERPPMELIFAIDPGAKIRLPEVASGWVRQAEGGMSLLSRALYGARMDTGVTRPDVGELRVSGSASAAGPGWSAEVTVKGPSGKPLPFVEAFVSVPGKLLSRGLTGPDGTLSIRGLQSDAVSVGLVNSVADQANIGRPGDGVATATGEISTGQRISLRGTWERAPENSSVGDLMVLIPASQEVMASRRQFMTHAAPIAFVDAAGRFDFGWVPAGLYQLRAGRVGEIPIDLQASGEADATDSATLAVSGTGESLAVEVHRD